MQIAHFCNFRDLATCCACLGSLKRLAFGDFELDDTVAIS